MDIHVITPFYREHLLPTLVEYLEPMNIKWYPIVAFSDRFSVCFGTNIISLQKDWIKPLVVNAEAVAIAFEKINKFIEEYPIIDDDYYCFMGDDDMYEPGFFNVVRQQTANILCVSLSRGNATPEVAVKASRHPVYPLIPKKLEDMQRNNIGLPQYIMKGHILKQMRFGNVEYCEDGIFAEKLRSGWPNDIIFLSDLFVFGNYFEPGRYTDDSWKIKPNWELPKII